MSEQGILMSAPMVRATLAGDKTNTRRIIKGKLASFLNWCAGSEGTDGLGQRWALNEKDGHSGVGLYVWSEADPDSGSECIKCPYGKPGDTLWVRERWKVASNWDDESPSEMPGLAMGTCDVRYFADGDTDLSGRARSSIHMPWWASRIRLKIESIRIEKLRDITPADAEAEGVFSHLAHCSRENVYRGKRGAAALKYFRALWATINGKSSWRRNPWVWRIQFRRVLPLP